MLYGRDAERAEIGALLDAARQSRSGALVVRGEPGIGKTALLADAREQARDMHVLTARGVESESDLPFAAVHQLLLPELDGLEQLPPPQAAALRGALGLEEGDAQEPFLVFAACLSLLAEVAERRPLLCTVDDAHWLDTASADALSFVARRLDAEGVVMLFGAREHEARTFDPVGVPSITLEALGDEAAQALFTQVAGNAAPSIREHLLEQAAGNALALVELPSSLSQAQLDGKEPLPHVLPVTRQVESIFLERVRRLSGEAQGLLLVAAADEVGDVGLVVHAAEQLGSEAKALAAAEEAGLVSVEGNELAFRHPVVRSAIYQAATSTERRDAHRALAQAFAEYDEHADRRAWHLAASVLEPDEGVVQALEEAAERAEERAGYMAAAKAFARAGELSADDDARGRRFARAARAARIAGADDYAVTLAAEAGPLVHDVVVQAELALAVGVAAFRQGRPLDGFPRLIDAARQVANRDLAKAVELLIWATGAASMGGNPTALEEVPRLAADLASAGDGSEAASVADALAASAQVRAGGRPSRTPRLEEAFAWAATSTDAQHVFAVSLAALFSGDDDRFAALIERATSLARQRGELGILAEALSMASVQHYISQRFDEAAVVASQALDFARELRAPNAEARPLLILAFVEAIRGNDEEVRRTTDEVIELAAKHGLPARATFAAYVRAMLDLGHGRWAEALEQLAIVTDPRPDVGDAFLAKGALPDVIEAAVHDGRLNVAREALSRFEELAAQSSLLWIEPRLASCRALLAGGDEATEHFEEAVRQGARGKPFDLARVQLLYGEHLRRGRSRTEARAQLRAALQTFERFRAEPWAERARAELRATGETARKRDPSTVDQLTAQELHIARLVAEGLTNKEVAAQLFLSPRTIDYHLRNVFAKLGITSRTQLARLRLDEDDVRAAPAAVTA